MIGYLQGKAIYSDGSRAIILTQNGIGYEVFCAYFTNTGSDVGFYTTQIVRETEHQLFAFKTLEDKKMFELLLTVNGVGPKSAYSLVGSLGTTGLVEAISYEQTNVLTKAPGIGKKAASQILLSLKEKIQEQFVNKGFYQDPAVANLGIEQMVFQESAPVNESAAMKDALLALTSLGYKEAQVVVALKKHFEADISSENLIKLALKEL